MRGFKSTTWKNPRIQKAQEFYENFCEQPFPTAITVEVIPTYSNTAHHVSSAM